MLYAIISDIHANLEALTAVLGDILRRRVDKIWCLGDIVDYGPDPHECIKLLREHIFIAVPGNHDLAAVGLLDTAEFNPDAVESNRWTRDRLEPADVAFLRGLPHVITEGDFTLVHASPRDPIWEYVVSADAAGENLPYFNTPFCLFGHTHRPVLFRCHEGKPCIVEGFSERKAIDLGKGRFFLNPGSIGQPRDGDKRASYAVYDADDGSIRLYRVPYDIAGTQAKMLKAKLPPDLISRLSYGL